MVNEGTLENKPPSNQLCLLTIKHKQTSCNYIKYVVTQPCARVKFPNTHLRKPISDLRFSCQNGHFCSDSHTVKMDTIILLILFCRFELGR